MPFPTARNAVPIAAVVLPLPGPVFTMISPRRTSLIAQPLIVPAVPVFDRYAVLGLPFPVRSESDMRKLIFVLLLSVVASAQTIQVHVDAREAPRRVFHAHLTIPASPGSLTLYRSEEHTSELQ